jgi:DHA2 family multidrug resistance protein
MAEDAIWTAVTGRRRLIATMALAAANFMVLLDMTVANVSVPHISGDLGISPSQGTWVITSYAVAEAICVPLTGWLAQRFGTVRTLTACVIGFGLFSVLCGLSTTLGMLVACRIGQGLSGGPLIPLTQTLLMRLNPPEKRGQAMGLWAMTTILAPVMGPVLGGWISDNFSWHWIFFINVPVVLFCAFVPYAFLRPIETPIAKLPIDRIGMGLLILSVGALQIMLDIGREHDWFADPMVLTLGIVALVGLITFVIWELTEEHPIVDLRVFRHRGFTVSALTMALGFSTYMAGIIIIPQWMQLSLGYNATQAGMATAATGFASLLLAWSVPRLIPRVDPRILISGAFIWIGGATLLRTDWTSSMDFFHLVLPQLIMGLGMPFMFITTTAVSLASVPPQQAASAAGLQNFLRIIGMALATSIVMTYWDSQARSSGSDLAGKLHSGPIETSLSQAGFSGEQIRMLIAQLVDKEALTLATDKVFLLAGLLMWAIAAFVWLAPRPKKISVQAGGH